MKSKLIIAGIILFTTAFLPAVSLFFLIRKRIIRSVFMESSSDRIFPLLNSAIFYYLSYYMLKGLQVSVVFSYYMLGATFLTICALVISFFTKISLHMISIGGLLGLLCGLALNYSLDLSAPIIMVIALAGLIGYARLKTNSHKQTEVYSGLLLGVFVLFLLFYLI